MYMYMNMIKEREYVLVHVHIFMFKFMYMFMRHGYGHGHGHVKIEWWNVDVEVSLPSSLLNRFSTTIVLHRYSGIVVSLVPLTTDSPLLPSYES